VAIVEAESDIECGWFDWCCNGWSAAQLWMFHQVGTGVSDHVYGLVII